MNPQDIKKILSDPRQLEWACRRGMLELDVLLGNFLREAYPQLDTQQQEYFVQLLEFPDPVLYAWLLGQEIPTEGWILSIIKMIQQHAYTRLQS